MSQLLDVPKVEVACLESLHRWEIIVFLSLMVPGLLSNSFILITFIKLPRIRSLTNYFVASLAFSDILILLTSPPLLLLIFLKKIDLKAGFVIRICCEIFCGMASLMNFACISVDRMIAISKPLYHRTLSPSRSLRFIAFIWFIAFVASLLKGLLIEVFHIHISYIFLIILFCLGFVVPTICTVVSYSIITRVVLRSSRDGLERNSQQDSRIRQTIRLTWKILLVILPSSTMWGCFWIVMVAQAEVSHTFNALVNMVPVLAATMNPIIYVVMTTEFRRHLIRLLNLGSTPNVSSPIFAGLSLQNLNSQSSLSVINRI